jgi:hypothetical protein
VVTVPESVGLVASNPRPLGAFITGSDAHLLDAFLRRHRAEVDGFLGLVTAAGYPAGLVRSFRAAVEQIHTAAAVSGSVASAAEAGSSEAVRALPSTTPSTAPSKPTTVTSQEAALMLGRSGRRVLQLLAAGRLDGRLVGRCWVVERASVLAYMEGDAA